MSDTERRRSVRAPAKLAMEIKISGEYARAESLNVSANGVYFSSSVHIPPLTRLEITLMLPASESARAKNTEVICEGVVVRVQPDKPEKNREAYEIACYFTAISEKDREQLESYILSQLAF